MGISISLFSTPEPLGRYEQLKQQPELSPEQQQQLSREAKERLLKERGVLIPPAFGVTSASAGGTNNNKRNVSPSVQEYDATSFYPSPWQRLCRMDPSHGLLYDYMQPGVWAKTGDDAAGNVAVLASLTSTTTATGTESTNAAATNTVPLGRIVGERYWFDKQIMTSIRGGSSNNINNTDGGGGDNATSLTTKLEVSPGLSVWASGNMNGEGWFSSNLNYTYNNNNIVNNDNASSSSSLSATKATSTTGASGDDDNVHLELISWIPFSNKNNNNSRRVLGDLHTFGALRVANRLTAATEAQISLDVLDVSNVKSYCSVDLMSSLSSSSSSSSNGTSADDNNLSPPPLQLTLERSSPTTSALCLSQVVCFDRLQFNPHEHRAPYVRNTAAWTIRLENTTTTTPVAAKNNSNTNNNSNLDAFSTMTDDYNMTDHSGGVGGGVVVPTSPMSSTTDIAVGAALQINRALAIKAVIRPMQKSITGALLLKRWKQPRVTCSILGQYSWQTHQTSFLGVGFELETTTTTATSTSTTASSSSSSSSDNLDHYYYYPANARPTGPAAPETKATLPPGGPE